MTRNSFGELGSVKIWMKDKRAVNIWVGSHWLRIGIAWQMVNVKQ